MEEYVQPEMEIVSFDIEDVIVTSSPACTGLDSENTCTGLDTLPIFPEEVDQCPNKDCKVYGIQW